MKKTLLIVLLFCITSFVFGQKQLSLMTEEYPPYNFEDADGLRGMAIEMIDLMLKDMDIGISKNDIDLLPWARSYNIIQHQPNTCLFSMTRSEKRENLFKWVGPISKTTVVLLAKKEKNVKITSDKDLLNYNITAIRDDIGEQLIVEKGYPDDKIDKSATALNCINKLFHDRVDLWAYEENVGKWLTKKSNQDPNELERVYVLTEAELYFAFHKDTPDETIEMFQSALDKIKIKGKDGKSQYDKILEKYLN